MFPIHMKCDISVSRSLAFWSASSSIFGIENISFKFPVPQRNQYRDKTEIDTPHLLKWQDHPILFHKAGGLALVTAWHLCSRVCSCHSQIPLQDCCLYCQIASGRDHSHTILSLWLAPVLFVGIDPAEESCCYAESCPQTFQQLQQSTLFRNPHLVPELR